jgi:hypothetical protein
VAVSAAPLRHSTAGRPADGLGWSLVTLGQRQPDSHGVVADLILGANTAKRCFFLVAVLRQHIAPNFSDSPVNLYIFRTLCRDCMSSSADRREPDAVFHAASSETLQEVAVLDSNLHGGLWTRTRNSEIHCRIIDPFSTTATQSLAHYNAFHAVSNLISPLDRMPFGRQNETSLVSPRLHHDTQILSELHTVMLQHACILASQSIFSSPGAGLTAKSIHHIRGSSKDCKLMEQPRFCVRCGGGADGGNYAGTCLEAAANPPMLQL